MNTLNLIRYSSVEKDRSLEKERKKSFLSSIEKKALIISGEGEKGKEGRKLFS